ncbi:ninja-family protein Os03g0419100-like isoform X2 [Andrographis paniculata]|uniref:ninja-family protein Os03g0419100-like isoform X2 n=1 Tax=Andrographis paniculata TaxID=175694 RepID=UPI0021E79270|nr:ninja-family protein Os03g0419100-like isoform X2 [Andrographis paniculata]
MDALKTPSEKEGKEDDLELSLELSIGGRYGYREEDNSQGRPMDFPDTNGCNLGGIFSVSRSDFRCNGGESRAECLDSQRRKEIQAMKRQVARRKREERIKKSRVVEDKVYLEAQKLQARVRDREIRERDGFAEDLGRKVANGNGYENVCLYPKVQHGYAHPPVNVSSLERSSSDHQSISQKGGCSSDSGSQSSHQSNHTLGKAPLEHLQARAEQTISQYIWSKFTEKSTIPQTSTREKIASTASKETTIPCTAKPEKNFPKATSPAAYMPCVSATGNGPNGKTITGFLCKYTNNEVTIVCGCHGNSFSPAEFVEHAGGVNISNPLRHITVLRGGDL